MLVYSSFQRTGGTSASGGERVRTDDLLRARQSLSELSYTPVSLGLSGIEPPTLRLSVVRSNHLSYRPLEVYSMALNLTDCRFR